MNDDVIDQRYLLEKCAAELSDICMRLEHCKRVQANLEKRLETVQKAVDALTQ